MQLVDEHMGKPIARWVPTFRRAIMATAALALVGATVALPASASAKKPGAISRNRTVVSYVAAMGGLTLAMGGMATENIPLAASGLTVAGISVVVMVKDVTTKMKDRGRGGQPTASFSGKKEMPVRPSWLAINFGKVSWAMKNLTKRKSSDFSDLPPGPRDLPR